MPFCLEGKKSIPTAERRTRRQNTKHEHNTAAPFHPSSYFAHARKRLRRAYAEDERLTTTGLHQNNKEKPSRNIIDGVGSRTSGIREK
jgi:hypothetical protein